MISLITVRRLAEELANGFGSDLEQVVLEVGCGAPDRSDHIPGSVWLDTNQIETEERCWSLVDDDVLLARLGERGISHASSVVIAGEPLVSARVAWALEYAGVGSVQILDGGFRRWMKDGGSLSHGWMRPRPLEFGIDTPRGKGVRASRDDVSHMLASNSTIVADVRSRAEHDGTTSGYSYIHTRGRIEGSVFARGGPNPNYLEDYTREGHFADCDRVAAMWRELGITDRACFYCGTGWRASVAFLFARWLGFEHASVYDGGWFDWSAGVRDRSDFHMKTGRREDFGVGHCSTRPAR